MKKVFLFYAACLLALFTGCAPKVITEIINQPHPATSTSEVRIYGVNGSAPQPAELIGKIKVTDTGLSTRCSYDQVIALAKKETAENGGNALALTQHRRPSLFSSCHQIVGNSLNGHYKRRFRQYYIFITNNIVTNKGISYLCT